MDVTFADRGRGASKALSAARWLKMGGKKITFLCRANCKWLLKMTLRWKKKMLVDSATVKHGYLELFKYFADPLTRTEWKSMKTKPIICSSSVSSSSVLLHRYRHWSCQSCSWMFTKKDDCNDSPHLVAKTNVSLFKCHSVELSTHHYNLNIFMKSKDQWLASVQAHSWRAVCFSNCASLPFLFRI